MQQSLDQSLGYKIAILVRLTAAQLSDPFRQIHIGAITPEVLSHVRKLS